MFHADASIHNNLKTICMKRYFLSALIALPLLILAFAFAATIKLTGKVIDEKGRPIRGASVRIKGMSKVTTTDTTGSFSIEAPGQKSLSNAVAKE